MFLFKLWMNNMIHKVKTKGDLDNSSHTAVIAEKGELDNSNHTAVSAELLRYENVNKRKRMRRRSKSSSSISHKWYSDCQKRPSPEREETHLAGHEMSKKMKRKVRQQATSKILQNALSSLETFFHEEFCADNADDDNSNRSVSFSDRVEIIHGNSRRTIEYISDERDSCSETSSDRCAWDCAELSTMDISPMQPKRSWR